MRPTLLLRLILPMLTRLCDVGQIGSCTDAQGPLVSLVLPGNIMKFDRFDRNQGGVIMDVVNAEQVRVFRMLPFYRSS